MHKKPRRKRPPGALSALKGLIFRIHPSLARRIARRRSRPSAFRRPARSMMVQFATRKPVALALQGGGAHGAFTWGVLDRLLEDGRFICEAASGTSAGALNAVVLAAGLAEGGPERAREKLAELWQGIAEIGNYSPFKPSLLDPLAAAWNSDWAASTFLYEFVTKTLSPYQLNPLAYNPLSDLIARLVNFELVHKGRMKLFIAATNLHSGRQRIFTEKEMRTEVILASACLPALNQAVEIEGEYYWDGGFTANPAILPMVMGSDTPDIVIVQVTPAHEPEVPTTARGIQSRLNRIIFNAPLHREIQALAWMQDVVRADGGDGRLGKKLGGLRLHHIDGEEVMRALGTASALNADWSFIHHLFDQGRERAEGWLAQHGKRIGVATTAALLQA